MQNQRPCSQSLGNWHLFKTTKAAPKVGAAVFNLERRTNMEPYFNRKMRRAMASKQNKIKHRIRTYRCYWDGVFLPTWVVTLRYTSVTLWCRLVGGGLGLPVTHMGKSRLKTRQFENKSSWKLATGGCSGLVSDWSDPPVGPPSLLCLLDPCVTPTQDAGSRGELQC